jgi:hypothetical protein
MLRAVQIRLARCTSSPFQASRTRTLRLLPQRRDNQEQQRDSSNSKGLRQQPLRLSRAPARVQNQTPAQCPATSLQRVFNARIRCRIRTDRVVLLRMERRRWWDRSALDLEGPDPPVWPPRRRGIRRRGRRCRDSLRRCVLASLVSARDHRDEMGKIKVMMRAAPSPSPTIWFEKFMKECVVVQCSAECRKAWRLK